MNKDDKVIKKALKHFESIQSSQSYMRKKGLECSEMVSGEQWDNDDIKQRKNKGRPIITVNMLSKPVDVVTNRHQENMSQIKISPFEDGDTEIARVINGLIKHIQASNFSNAKMAYRNAFYDAIVYGYGYWRVSSERNEYNPFEQNLIIEPIEDPNSVYMENDDVCIITEKITTEEFKNRFPKAKTISWENSSDNAFIISEDEIIIAEYWERIKTPVKKYKIERAKINQAIIDIQPQEANIQAVQENEIVVVSEDELNEMQEGSYEIIDEVETEDITVKQYLLSPAEILDSMVWPGKYIPVVGVYGQKHKKENGQIFYKSLIYDAISPQKLCNYHLSQYAEILQQLPKSKVMGVEGQFEGNEEYWANSDQEPYLEYKNVSINGQAAPPPQMLPAPQISPGFVQSGQQYEQYVKATTGIYDPSLGANSPEVSGRAILARQSASNLSTEQFNISFNMALRETGVILVDLIPHFYDSERTVKIVGDDMKEETVIINKKYRNALGEEKFYPVNKVLHCDVVISSSYSAATRRMEIVETLLDFIKVFPASAQVTGDIIAGALDFEKSEELEHRLKAMIPEQLFSRMKQLEQEEKGQVSPEQQQIMKMQQAMQQMQAQLAKTGEDAKRLFQENEMLKRRENSIKLQVEQVRNQGDLAQERMKQEGALKRELIKKDKRL